MFIKPACSVQKQKQINYLNPVKYTKACLYADTFRIIVSHPPFIVFIFFWREEGFICSFSRFFHLFFTFCLGDSDCPFLFLLSPRRRSWRGDMEVEFGFLCLPLFVIGLLFDQLFDHLFDHPLAVRQISLLLTCITFSQNREPLGPRFAYSILDPHAISPRQLGCTSPNVQIWSSAHDFT